MCLCFLIHSVRVNAMLMLMCHALFSLSLLPVDHTMNTGIVTWDFTFHSLLIVISPSSCNHHQQQQQQQQQQRHQHLPSYIPSHDMKVILISLHTHYKRRHKHKHSLPASSSIPFMMMMMMMMMIVDSLYFHFMFPCTRYPVYHSFFFPLFPSITSLSHKHNKCRWFRHVVHSTQNEKMCRMRGRPACEKANTMKEKRLFAKMIYTTGYCV